MTTPQNMAFLNVARVNGIMYGLQDPRTIPQDLVWLKRTAVVPAQDEEIMARYYGQVLAADLIADDQKAVVYSQGRFQFESTKIPNIKVGRAVNQAMMTVLRRMQEGYASPVDNGIFSEWENRYLDECLTGVRQRMESLIVAMLCDNLSYNRLGISLQGITWGMFADLKVTTVIDWSVAGSATPVNDILGVCLTAKIRYGIIYDRITMSTQAFRYMIATTEFQNKARTYITPLLTFANLALANIGQQLQIAQNALMGMTVELYDARFWSQDEYGVITQGPYLPVTSVLLTDSKNDNKRTVMDFANAIVMESVVGSLVGSSVVGSFNGAKYGPVGYVTPTNVDLNSPGITYWGVARGFPRKWQQNSSACLTVGTFTDMIPVGVPIPQ
jgi:hypothetical protein